MAETDKGAPAPALADPAAAAAGLAPAAAGDVDPVTTGDVVAAHRAEAPFAPITPAAPSTQPAPAAHDNLPDALATRLLDQHGNAVRLPHGTEGGLRHSAEHTDPRPHHYTPPSPQAQALGEAVRAERVVRQRGIVDHLMEHPDAVVRAKAREAVASLDAGAADASILARAAVDTARELDRSSGRLTYALPATTTRRATDI